MTNSAIAGLIMVFTGFNRADAAASLLVVALMAHAALSLLRQFGRFLLEAAPADLDYDTIGDALAAHDGVVEVHDPAGEVFAIVSR